MKITDKLWVIEAHDLGALQVREVRDALVLNRKRWQALRRDEASCSGQAGKVSDRLMVGLAETIEEALAVARELKRMRRNAPAHHEPSGDRVREDVGYSVKMIIAEWLRSHDFEGLCNPDEQCGCLAEDLAPCDCENVLDCQPGHREDVDEGAVCGCDSQGEKHWHIVLPLPNAEVQGRLPRERTDE